MNLCKDLILCISEYLDDCYPFMINKYIHSIQFENIKHVLKLRYGYAGPLNSNILLSKYKSIERIIGKQYNIQFKELNLQIRDIRTTKYDYVDKVFNLNRPHNRYKDNFIGWNNFRITLKTIKPMVLSRINFEIHIGGSPVHQLKGNDIYALYHNQGSEWDENQCIQLLNHINDIIIAVEYHEVIIMDMSDYTDNVILDRCITVDNIYSNNPIDTNALVCRPICRQLWLRKNEKQIELYLGEQITNIYFYFTDLNESIIDCGWDAITLIFWEHIIYGENIKKITFLRDEIVQISPNYYCIPLFSFQRCGDKYTKYNVKQINRKRDHVSLLMTFNAIDREQYTINICEQKFSTYFIYNNMWGLAWNGT